MPKKTKTEPDDPEQSKRFVDTAHALVVNESGNLFARAFGTVVPLKAKAKRSKPKAKVRLKQKPR